MPVAGALGTALAADAQPGGLRIGWASVDITPEGPVVMAGGARARLSTGVMDPIGMTALVLESIGEDGKTAALVAQVSVELSSLRAAAAKFCKKRCE